MSTVKELETKLDELIDAHRALAAQHEAVFITSQIMLALINAPLPMVQHLLEKNSRMVGERTDPEYHSLFAAALTELQAAALAAKT